MQIELTTAHLFVEYMRLEDVGESAHGEVPNWKVLDGSIVDFPTGFMPPAVCRPRVYSIRGAVRNSRWP